MRAHSQDNNKVIFLLPYYFILCYLNGKYLVPHYIPPGQLRYGIKGGGFAKALWLGSNGKPGSLWPRVNA